MNNQRTEQAAIGEKAIGGKRKGADHPEDNSRQDKRDSGDYLADLSMVSSNVAKKRQRQVAPKGLISDWKKRVVPKKPKTTKTNLIPSVQQSASSSQVSLTSFNEDNSQDEHEDSDDGFAQPGAFDEDEGEDALRVACAAKNGPMADTDHVGSGGSGGVGKGAARRTAQVCTLIR